ncbi:MAG: IS1380 family transposase [Candidatus Brocadiia bacterium]
MTACPEQLTFSFHPCKEVVADFCGGHLTSDGGLLPLVDLDRRLGWTARVAETLDDPRDPAKTEHTLLQFVRQRLFGLVAGYEDGNDHTRLRDDALLKTAAGKPLQKPLASQPTISRLENLATARAVAEMNRLLVETFVQVQTLRGRRPGRLVLDIDPTDDPCHGHQQLALFNGFYGQYMYLPLLVYERESGMLVGVRLQSGTAPPGGRAVPLLKPLVRRLRAEWPETEIVVRGDAAFGCPRMYRFCETQGLGYIFGLKATDPLQKRTDGPLARVRDRFDRTGAPQRHVASFWHRAGSWSRRRRTLYKVEANAQGTNRRFGITNLPGPAADLWPFYNDRGTAETFIDDLKNGLKMDRLSCEGFVANAFRLALTAVAYNLLRVFREALAGTALEGASVETIRSRLLKVGARVRQTVRRIWVHLSSAFPLREVLAHATAAVQGLSPPALA